MHPVAGISCPDTPLCTEVITFVRRHSPPFLFNHVMRAYLYGECIGRAGRIAYDSETLLCATVMHDLGLTGLAPVRARFEIEGADAAKAFLAEHGASDRVAETVWDAIALHTTAEIPIRKGGEIALCHLGTAADLRIIDPHGLDSGVIRDVVDVYPHLDLEAALIDTLVGLYRTSKVAAASHAVADACERKVPGFRRFNLCDVLLGADPAPPKAPPIS